MTCVSSFSRCWYPSSSAFIFFAQHTLVYPRRTINQKSFRSLYNNIGCLWLLKNSLSFFLKMNFNNFLKQKWWICAINPRMEFLVEEQHYGSPPCFVGEFKMELQKEFDCSKMWKKEKSKSYFLRESKSHKKCNFCMHNCLISFFSILMKI